MNKIKNINAEFKKANKAQKRVMIAQDVLAQLKAKRYVAESGCWVQANYNPTVTLAEIKYDDSVQELFAEKTIESCNVCALGGLFMSCTNLNNNTLLEELDDVSEDLGNLIDEEEKLSNKLNKIFSIPQLKWIETYFEANGGYFRDYDEDNRIKNFSKEIEIVKGAVRSSEANTSGSLFTRCNVSPRSLQGET